MERSYWNDLTRFEKNAVVIGLWFCIGELSNFVCILIGKKLGVLFYALATLWIYKEGMIDTFNKVYPGWIFLAIYIWTFYIILPLILIVINVRHNKIANERLFR